MPWWVPLVFIYCFWIGWHCTKARPAHLSVFFIFPAVLIGLSFASLWNCAYVFRGSYVLSLVVGTLIGWFMSNGVPIIMNKPSKIVTVPGTWQLMILLMVLFFAKFTFGSLRVRMPEVAAHYALIEWVVQGIISGFLLGKGLNFVRRYMTAR